MFVARLGKINPSQMPQPAMSAERTPVKPRWASKPDRAQAKTKSGLIWTDLVSMWEGVRREKL